MLPGIAPSLGFGGTAASVPAVVTYIGVKAGASSTNNNVNIGTAATDRYVVIILATAKGPPPAPNHSSVTVAGVSCTRVVQSTTTGLNGFRTSIWISSSPITSGTTATVSLSYGTVTGASFMVYTLNGINSPTAYATANNTGGPGTVSSTIDYPLNGVLIAANEAEVAYTSTPTWTGATTDVSSSVSAYFYTSASKSSLAALSAQTISCAPSGTSTTNGSTLVAATWSPA